MTACANTARRIEQTNIRRFILIQAMGGKCNYCPCTDSAQMEFHHTKPRTWKTRNLSRWTRQGMYEREWLEGTIELACSDCNKRLGEPADPTDEPF